MEKIYQEVREKSGKMDTNSPCVSVRVYVPNREEDYDLPALIALESGKVSSFGSCIFKDSHWEVMSEKGRPGAIRKAIQMFDQLVKETFNE